MLLRLANLVRLSPRPAAITTSCWSRVLSTQQQHPPPPTLAQTVVDDYAPKPARPYMRLMRMDRPIGTYLLFWPCAWSIALAAPASSLPHLPTLSLFACGALIMRGAGCTINDLWDRDVDKRVERTKSRPLASGEITPLDAMVFLTGQMGVGLMILLQLNTYSVLLGASSLGLVVTYPLAKRFTYWPQLMLGLTFNWGALLGWAACRGSLDLSVCLPLYLSCVCWTLVYDTIYAHQDTKDDKALGLKSTALRFGEQSQLWLSGFAAAMVSGLTLAGFAADQTWPYYCGVGAAAAHLAWQVGTLDIGNAPDCGRKFVANHRLGALVFLGIVLGTLLKKEPEADREKQKLNDNA